MRRREQQSEREYVGKGNLKRGGVRCETFDRTVSVVLKTLFHWGSIYRTFSGAKWGSMELF